MNKFYFYKVHGLNVKSSIFFPELVIENSNPEIYIHFDRSLSKIRIKNKGFYETLYSPDDVLYSLNGEALFRVRSGKEILINDVLNVNIVYLRHLILGPGIGTLLRQRGYLVLHASAVNIEDKAVVFLGGSGDGKSTTAAEFYNRGYNFITDDVLRVKFDENNRPFAIPSFPRAKLWKDIIEYMKNHSNLAKIHPEIDKYSFNVDNCFKTKQVPIKNIYVLENDAQNRIIPLTNSDALIELVKSSYAVNLFGNTGKSENLIQCSKLIKNTRVKRLTKREKLKELDDLILIVENDIKVKSE